MINRTISKGAIPFEFALILNTIRINSPCSKILLRKSTKNLRKGEIIMKNKFFIIGFILALFFLVSNMTGCAKRSQEKEKVAKKTTTNACVTCHTDYDYLLDKAQDKLTKLKAEKKGKDSEGEQITAETIAKKIYVSDEYLNTIHGKQSCIECHNGNVKTKDEAKAHAKENNFIVNPTADGGSQCANCHKDIVDKYKNSIHFTISGIRHAVLERLGTTQNAEALAKNIVNKDCTGCHATCGECHVSNPKPAGKGLLKGHVFITEANIEKTCVPCHYTTGADYVSKNVHYNKGMKCNDCHKNLQDVHGQGQVKQEMEASVSCEDCHKDLQNKNNAHKIHGDKIRCYSCHVQPYPNCRNCHEGKAEKKYEAVKLGLNEKGLIQPFVETAMSTEMFLKHGVELKMEDINRRPFWAPYAPHSIVKAPIIKEGAKKVCENCHGNPDVFLQEKDLDTEVGKKILVKHLPEPIN